MKKTKRTLWFVLIALLFFFIAHRLPAPVVEAPEKPPAPEQETKPKWSHRAKSRSVEREDTGTHEKTNRVESVKAAPAIKSANFAGTWSGTISQGIVGRGTVTLTINAAGTQVAEKSSYGSFVRHGTCDGRTASWRGGAFGDLAWTLTPNPDGQTALVSAKGLFAGTTPATFIRTQGASSSIPGAQAEIPVARRIPDKPGFVYSPFEPKILDVRGKASGTKASDSSGREFMVP